MYCSNCGFKLESENVNFCPQCGAKLNTGAKPIFTETVIPEQPAELNTSVMAPDPTPTFEKPEKVKVPIIKDGKLTVKGIGMVIMAVMLIIIAYFVYGWYVNYLSVYLSNPSMSLEEWYEKTEGTSSKTSTGTSAKNNSSSSNTTSTQASTPTVTSDPEPVEEYFDPGSYEFRFGIDEVKQSVTSNLFNFVDEWGGKRIAVEGVIYEFSTNYKGERTVRIKQYNWQSDYFDYEFTVYGILAEDGTRDATGLSVGSYGTIVGDVDSENSEQDTLWLKNCYLYGIDQ